MWISICTRATEIEFGKGCHKVAIFATKNQRAFFIVYISFYLLTRFALQVLAASPPGVTRSLGMGEREEEKRKIKVTRLEWFQQNKTEGNNSYSSK